MDEKKDFCDALIVSKYEQAQELLGPHIIVEVGSNYFYTNRQFQGFSVHQNYFYSVDSLLSYAMGYSDAKEELK